MLKEGYFADMSPNPENGAVLHAVKLVAEVSSRADMVTVRPLGEEDEALIARHCEKMQRLGVGPRMFMKEPPRPGIPILPRIIH